jgi:hypothetical protein
MKKFWYLESSSRLPAGYWENGRCWEETQESNVADIANEGNALKKLDHINIYKYNKALRHHVCGDDSRRGAL